MSVQQLYRLFLIERDKDGLPKFPTPRGEREPSLKELHRYKCFVLGIRDKALVEQLWRDEQAKRKKNTTEPKGRGRRGK